ncbi:hypothetical protein ACOMHN_040814 [Nucella lapillus]
MYFCPCSCSKADCENEEDVLIYLPRNLSYAGESYLDRYSVSSAYVNNSKLEKQLLQADVEDGYLKAGAAACAELTKELERGEEGEGREKGREKEDDEEDSCSGSESEHLLGARAMASPAACSDDSIFRGRGGPDSCDVTVEDTPTMSLTSTTTTSTHHPPSSSTSTPLLPPQLTVTIDKGSESETLRSKFDRCVVNTVESPDSDLVSEEGIFVNMMDDLDGLPGDGGPCGGKSTLSEASDDTYVSGDSMYYSPVEAEEIEDEHARGELKVSLEEAVQQAAFTFQAPPPVSPKSSPLEVCDGNVVLSLPLPHANDGESEDGASSRDKDSGESRSNSESKDSSAATSEDSTTTTTTTTKSTTVSQSPKNANNLEIKLTDMSTAPPTTTTTTPTPKVQTDDKGPLTSSYRDLLSPDSPLYEDREFNFTRTELRKSTSLKSTKTPPGTPRRKKVVRFADAMGLDLESVRHVLNMESPPKIPPSAMKDLHPGLTEDRKTMGSRYITETFAQPGADVHFRDRVIAEKAILENALIVSGSITGVIRVANIGFHKAVRVRFTTNGWASFHDIAASYMVNSNDGATDRFSFTLVPPPDFGPGSRLECAISYSVNGVDYWDNNYGNNYVFECYAKTVPTEAENAWMHFL